MKRGSALLAVSVVVIAVLLLSTAHVFAKDTTEITLDEGNGREVSGNTAGFMRGRMAWPWDKKEKVDIEEIKKRKLERFKTMLSDLVDAGVITQDKSDTILKQYEEFMASKEMLIKQRKPIFDQLVEEGILTQKEADAVKEVLLEKRNTKTKRRMFNKGNKGEALKEALSALADKGVLTQDKVDKVVKFFEDRVAERQEMKKRGDFWDQMVTKGIITEEEAEKIRENCRKYHAPRFKHKRGLKNRKAQ